MKRIANYKNDTGENVLWHPGEQALYWVDIPRGHLFYGRFAGGKFMSSCVLELDEPVGGFVFSRSGGLLLFASQGNIYRWAHDGQLELLYRPEEPEREWVPVRYNDVLALPNGDVLCGSMPRPGESDSRLLYFSISQRRLSPVLEGLKLSNGMGLSPDWKYLYLADTRDFAVFRFPFRSREGTLGSREYLIDFKGRPGRPDGLTVDRFGRIWIAETGAGLISCFAADGTPLGSLPVGTPKVTSVCFGGTGLQSLFVSTQGGDPAQSDDEPAGGLFRFSAERPEDLLLLKRSVLGIESAKDFCGREEYSSL